jgi:hypothetical protein
MDVFSGVKNAIALVVKAKQLADQLKNLELKQVIVDLQSQLVDLKEEIVNFREENLALKAQVQRLSAAPEVVVRDGLYFKNDGDGPYCTQCYDSEKKLIRVAELAGHLKAFWQVALPDLHNEVFLTVDGEGTLRQSRGVGNLATLDGET